MSEFKNKIKKNIKDIENTITNKEEKQKVMKSIEDIISTFTSYVVTICERQTEMEDKIDEIYDILTNIEDGIKNEDTPILDAVCPYCGETIPIYYINNDEDFECPNCHHVVEYELNTKSFKSIKNKDMEYKSPLNPDSIIDYLSNDSNPYEDSLINDQNDIDNYDIGEDDIPF